MSSDDCDTTLVMFYSSFMHIDGSMLTVTHYFELKVIVQQFPTQLIDKDMLQM